jgi:uncharacterized membrane protein YfcA
VLTATVFIYVLEKARIHTLQVTSKGVAGLLGFVLGVFSSFLGIGGGPINIMFLSYFFSMDSKHAALNSLYIIFFSQVANFLTNVIQGTFPEFNMLLLVSMMVTGIVGAMVGRSLTKRLANEQVDRLFMGVMLLIVFLSAFNVWKFASL